MKDVFSYICISNKDSQFVKSNNRVVSRLDVRVVSRLDVSEGLAQYSLESGHVSGGQLMGRRQGLGLKNQGQDQQAEETFKCVQVKNGMQFI